MDVQPEHRGNLSVRQPHSCDVTRRRLIVNPPDMPNWHAGTPTTVSMTKTQVSLSDPAAQEPARPHIHFQSQTSCSIILIISLPTNQPTRSAVLPAVTGRGGWRWSSSDTLSLAGRVRRLLGDSMPARLVRWDSIWGWLSQLDPLEPSGPRHPAKS